MATYHHFTVCDVAEGSKALCFARVHLGNIPRIEYYVRTLPINPIGSLERFSSYTDAMAAFHRMEEA